MSKTKSPTVVSIFSGAGGIDLGFAAENFHTVLATDIWDKACETLKLNRISDKVICDDIRNVGFSEFKKALGGDVNVLVGGPPCPAFSKSRFYIKDKKRALEDENSFTVIEYFRALEELRPDVFFFENVFGFVYKPHQAALEYLKQRCSELGYKAFYKVVNAADFGVPQTRERFICIGIRKDLPDFVYPQPTHINPDKLSELLPFELLPWRTCGDTIGDIDFELPEDEAMTAGSKHKELLKLVPPGDNYLFFTAERGHPEPIFKWRSRYWSFLLKLSPERPSWTIQASHSNNMGPFHWRNRFLRISELKRLQSFPDSMRLTGTYRDQWRLIGNAVPPLLAQHFARHIYDQYFQ